MAWSVDRLGRSLQDLVGFLSEIHAAGVDLFLHQQGILRYLAQALSTPWRLQSGQDFRFQLWRYPRPDLLRLRGELLQS